MKNLWLFPLMLFSALPALASNTDDANTCLGSIRIALSAYKKSTLDAQHPDMTRLDQMVEFYAAEYPFTYVMDDAKFMAKKFAGREIFIGLDAAVSLGEPSVIAVGLLMVPITIILAFIVPGNQLLPFADLAVIPFIVCLITAMSKGNVIRSLMISTIVMAIVLVFATNLAPAETIMAKTAGVTLPDGATLIGNLDRANLITWLLVKFFSLFK